MKRGFDSVARIYRFAELLTMGGALHRARLAHVTRLAAASRVLVLGEGDGRFLEALLQVNKQCQVVVVESSQAMVELATGRVQAEASRVKFQCMDVSDFPRPAPNQPLFDAVVTLFFLDCFEDPELSRVVELLAAWLAPRGVWLYADFTLPAKGGARAFAQAWIALLYRAFGWLTEIRARKLDNPLPIMQRHGLHIDATSGGGMLTSRVLIRHVAHKRT